MNWKNGCQPDAGSIPALPRWGEILDVDFGMFRRMLEYKCAQTGARLHIVDRWYPSSKTCSNCGTVKAKLSLKERVYRCDHCRLVIDRALTRPST